jgi:hypothetical protein
MIIDMSFFVSTPYVPHSWGILKIGDTPKTPAGEFLLHLFL